jgi:hypothetical protein
LPAALASVPFGFLLVRVRVWRRNSSDHASAPPRSYGQRLELAEGASLQEFLCHCTDKAGNSCSAPLQICRIALFLPRQHRDAPGNGLGTTIKYLQRATSSAADNGLGATMIYLRRTGSCTAGRNLGAAIKYLWRSTSGAAGNGLGAMTNYLRGAASIDLGTTIKYL